jgi:hypothetical protein
MFKGGSNCKSCSNLITFSLYDDNRKPATNAGCTLNLDVAVPHHASSR